MQTTNTTSTSLENLLNSTLRNLQRCDCEKETEFEFSSVKQNTVEEFEFECSRCGKKVNLMSSIPAVKATIRPTSAGRNFVALSFLVNGQYFKDYYKILGTSGLDHVSFTQWIRIVEWIAPFVKRIANWSVQKARTEAVRCGEKNPVRRLLYDWRPLQLWRYLPRCEE